MLATAPSPWLIVGPALIAGSIGLISAGLSFVSARESLAHAAAADRMARGHQLDLLIFERRFLSIERIWQFLFQVEQAQEVTPSSRADVVRASVWLPEETRRSVLQAILDLHERNPDPITLQRVRESLLAYTSTMQEAKDE